MFLFTFLIYNKTFVSDHLFHLMKSDRILRIGLLVPSSNTTMEPDFYKMIPKGVSVHTSRMWLEKVTAEGLMEMSKDAIKASKLLETADIDIIVFGCTSGSLIGGVEWEKKLVEGILENTGIPTISTGRAVVDALKTLGGKKSESLHLTLTKLTC